MANYGVVIQQKTHRCAFYNNMATMPLSFFLRTVAFVKYKYQIYNHISNKMLVTILRHYELKYFYKNSLSIYNNRIKLRLDITFVVTQGFKDLLLTEIDF